MTEAQSELKSTGTYYTPRLLSDFIIYHIFDPKNYTLRDEVAILEPSAGDGIFFESIFDNHYFKERLKLPKKISIHAVERDKKALDKAKQGNDRHITKPHSIKYINDDYLNYQSSNFKKFDLIIGNPPYIKRGYLTKDQINQCESIHKACGLSNKKIKNIWTSFLLGAVQSLSSDGILAFVLPAELLQVIYAKELRDLLRDTFEKIEIFTFNELIFKDIDQDVVILICAKEQGNGVSFYHVDELTKLEEPDYTKDNSNVHRETLDKWTNYILSDDDLKFLDKLKVKMQALKLQDYAESNAGIVTAANDYLITDQEVIDKYSLAKVAKPILKKGSYMKASAIFTKKDLSQIKNSGMPTSLLLFEDKPCTNFPEGYRQYISLGVSRQLDQRYKMLCRNNWYVVPSVSSSEGFFTKRSNIFPRLVVNEAGALVTDSFYRVNAKKEYALIDIVFSFYNTLTLIHAELEGRYYGGSVLELTPNEFKRLAIPLFTNVPDELFKELDNLLRNQNKISKILDFTDRVILKDYFNLSNNEIKKLRSIYVDLLRRRLKKVSEDFEY